MLHAHIVVEGDGPVWSVLAYRRRYLERTWKASIDAHFVSFVKCFCELALAI